MHVAYPYNKSVSGPYVAYNLWNKDIIHYILYLYIYTFFLYMNYIYTFNPTQDVIHDISMSVY